MSKTSNSNWETTVKPIVVLSVISLVVSLLLALVNGMTAPVIKENTRRTTLAAYVSVMPSVSDAATLEEVTDYTTANVTGVVKAPDGGIAIKAEEKGFDGGIVKVIVGFDAGGTVTGIYVDASTQTAGIGSHVADEDYLAQFSGIDGTQNVEMNNGLDGVTGATYSSKALFAAVNDCINCYKEVALGAAATIVEEYVNPTKEEAVAAMAPGAAALETVPEGCTEAYSNGDITVLGASSMGVHGQVPVLVAFDSTGAITQVWVDASGEEMGKGCMEPAFTGEFVGLTDTASVDGVDAVSGSTYTSDAVKKAVDACVAGFAAM